MAHFVTTRRENEHVFSQNFGGIIRISGRISMKRQGDHSDKPPYPSDPPNPRLRSKVLETLGAARYAVN